MLWETAYQRRASLDDYDLERLRKSIVDEIERYKLACRGYTPDKWEKYGKPFLAKLEGPLATVEKLQKARLKAGLK